jgi:hypothetical protein
MSTNDKNKKFPSPFDGAYPNREESGDFRKIDVDDDVDDDADDVNFMDMPPSTTAADGDENYQDEDEKRSRKDYRDDTMIEETKE